MCIPNHKYVLYAEDDEDDQMLLQEVLASEKKGLCLVTVDNGEAALEYLDALEETAPPPCLIILDLNMPVRDGLETLEKIKSKERFVQIPVVLFSTSLSEVSRQAALERGAVAFVTKPSSYLELQTIVKSFVGYFEEI
jgi:CheY-like chemotaxis protein